MKRSNRRDFLKTSILGVGVTIGGIPLCTDGKVRSGNTIPKEKGVQKFNMCGYAAPKIDEVRIGFIGLGNRGIGAVRRIVQISQVKIVALGDKYPEKVNRAQEVLVKSGLPKAADYSGTEDIWKEMCEKPDIDLIYICTPWKLHTPMSLQAMENGKHVAVEVPAARTVDEAWALVETSERTRKHCMMLENCCYDFFELLTLNMAQQGFFGEIVHGEGAYIHDLLEYNLIKNGFDMWRLKENIRNGNLYPTHGLGPVCQAMNINRGDKMEYMTSMSTDDFQLAAKVNKMALEDSFYQPFANQKYRGNMNTSVIRTAKGKTIMVQHDITSPRPYSRIHTLSGTKGIAQKWPLPGRVSVGHEWFGEEELKRLEAQYTPKIVKKIGEIAKKVGGHGGMDFMMDWRLIDNLRNGLALDQDVYDAALWSVIAPLSEWSVKNRSNSVDVPDFTRGSWQTNQPVDLSMTKGGNTGVRNVDHNPELQMHI